MDEYRKFNHGFNFPRMIYLIHLIYSWSFDVILHPSYKNVCMVLDVSFI